jgi:hypothetical protein
MVQSQPGLIVQKTLSQKNSSKRKKKKKRAGRVAMYSNPSTEKKFSGPFSKKFTLPFILD